MTIEKLKETLSKLSVETLSVSPDGHLLIDGTDIVDHLKAAGVDLPEGIVHPLNWVQCNVSNCGAT